MREYRLTIAPGAERNYDRRMTTTFLVSPSEPAQLKQLLEDVVVSDEAEHHGADVLTYTHKFGRAVSIGWQRKTVADLLSSFTDGRIYDLSKLSHLSVPKLIIEGRINTNRAGYIYRTDGTLTKFTQTAIDSFCNTCSDAYNIDIWHSKNVEDTARKIVEYMTWFHKAQHLSIVRRAPLQSEWGVPSNREKYIYFLQGIDTMGPVTAQKILDHYKNKIPMQWTVSTEDLQKIDGIGKKKADAIIGFLD